MGKLEEITVKSGETGNVGEIGGEIWGEMAKIGEMWGKLGVNQEKTSGIWGKTVGKL